MKHLFNNHQRSACQQMLGSVRLVEYWSVSERSLVWWASW